MSEQTRTGGTVPYFSIVIPAYNEEDYIGLCLQSISNSDYDSARYEVIVVDNGSQDRTHEVALNSGRAKVYQLLEGNVGAVRNYGAAQVSGQILVFIDADCLMDNCWLNRAEKLIKDRPNCVYGGGAKLPSDITWIEKSWLLENNGQPTLPKRLIGASTILSKELFLKIGGFDEIATSGEDSDLHNRLISENVPVFIDHALDVTHLGNAKTIIQFIRRQIWHSENYIVNIKKSLLDPILLLTSIFVMSTFSLSLDIISLSFKQDFFITLLLWCTLPLPLSFKRIFRACYSSLKPSTFLKIYILDLLYLCGRGIGLLKGVLNLNRHFI